VHTALSLAKPASPASLLEKAERAERHDIHTVLEAGRCSGAISVSDQRGVTLCKPFGRDLQNRAHSTLSSPGCLKGFLARVVVEATTARVFSLANAPQLSLLTDVVP